jgi:hypothetical protein
MSVLELSDESRIIRDAARAWARGDIPLEDYRMIRRATLDGICGIESSYDEENDTAPNDDTEVVDPAAVGAPPARGSMPLMIGGVVVVAVVVALVLALR